MQWLRSAVPATTSSRLGMLSMKMGGSHEVRAVVAFGSRDRWHCGLVRAWAWRRSRQHKLRLYRQTGRPAVAFPQREGSWRGGDLANKINTVEIICDPSEGRCNLHQADVVSLSGRPWLSLYNTSFLITKLDAQSVVAEPSSSDLCIRQTLTFDRVAKAVTLVRTKINREDACSTVQDEPISSFLESHFDKLLVRAWRAVRRAAAAAARASKMRCCPSSQTSRAAASRSMATVRRDAASIEVTRALHSDLGNSRRCEFVRRLQVMSTLGQTGHRADKAE